MTTITIHVAEEGGETGTLMFQIDKEAEGQWLLEHERDVTVEGEEFGLGYTGPLIPRLTGKGKLRMTLVYTREIRQATGKSQA